MKKLVMYSLLLCCIMFFVAGSAFAKPGADAPDETVYVGNGMPSGPHVNLNIHGKDPANFLCPEMTVPNNGLTGEEFDELGLPAGYWKNTCSTPPFNETCYKQDTSIHVPEYSDDPICGGIEQRIVIQSGKENGHPKKGGLDITLPTDQIIVKDACTECFADEWDWAEFQLPPCDAGYKVYGRALGKPAKSDEESDIRKIIISAGKLLTATDITGQNLLELGEVIGTEITIATGDVVNTTRKKGKPKTVTFSDLFKFTGTICYLEEPESWDSKVLLCCTDYGSPDPDNPDEFLYGVQDGIYDVCVLKRDTDDSGVVDEDDSCPVWIEYEIAEEQWICYLDEDGDGIYDQADDEPSIPSDGYGNCPTEVKNETAFCQFHDDVWIFSIADLVEYYFGVVNDGVKLFQIRFYPIDPDCFTSSQ